MLFIDENFFTESRMSRSSCAMVATGGSNGGDSFSTFCRMILTIMAGALERNGASFLA
jgi:hypothetical protein